MNQPIIKYGSVCSGIEAATVAWDSLGWKPVFFSEIEPFPCAVLKHHYPAVPNYGDMTKFEEWPDESIDLLVGGTPCQSFSVAGLRKGLADPRGNLMLTYGAIARRYGPEWLVWENVPGVLSSNGGRDFGTFLGMLAELGYGFAYRVLDAQYFGVAQRRRRVFVVANARSWQRAAAVLFERESLCGNPAPSREAGEGVARGVARCFAGSSESRIAATLETTSHDYSRADGFNMVAQPVATFAKTHKPMSDTDAEGWSPIDAAPTITHWPRDRSDAGTDVTVVQPVAIRTANTSANGHGVSVEVAHTLRAQYDAGEDGTGRGTPLVPHAMQVRRLTPVECERLQGFPDNYTNIPWRKSPESPDGPRYKALGNSMAVPVMNWIGQRIQKVSEL